MSKHTGARRWSRLAAAVVMATAGLVTMTAAPAQAITFYDDKSPDALWTGNGGIKYRCSDDAQTVREAYWPGGGPLAVELRYSRRCRTAWARASVAYDLEIRSWWSQSSHRTTRSSGKNPGADSSINHWTVMLDDAGLLADACIVFQNSDMYWERICTSKY
ncbi:DUF2690 domain-containing protein [Actinoplanes sp. NPDC051861]|uniref:DUF2690 domain-containing protein n=1 Tax=Actinoplanes sp. NPDC051861 TaxID=3155170 RepID=UPI00342EB1DE